MRFASRCLPLLSLLLGLGSSSAGAQMPSDAADKVRALGRVVAPVETAAIYRPRMIEAEPYPGVVVQRDIRYGENERHLLDVFAPSGSAAAPRPVFMFVHGGAFVAGDRRGPNASPFYDNVMLWAVRHGMVGVNMTYRRAPQSPWPAGAEDVGAAMRWVHESIAARGGDPSRVYLMGHSAGAVHVASYIAQPRFQQASGSGVAGALLLSGLYDIPRAEVNPPLLAYFGAEASRYAEQSSLPGLIGTRVPLWVGVGGYEPADFEKQSLLLNDALCAKARCPTFQVFPGHSHMSLIYSIHSDDMSVGDSMLEFISKRR